MDFAALMSKEISKAKGSPTEEKPPEKKFVRRGEEEATRVAAYNQEQEQSRREREERLTQKRKLEDEEAERRRERDDKRRRLADESRQRREEEEAAIDRQRRKILGLPEVPATSEADTPAEEEEDIAEEELIEKLREYNEPVRLFGEGHEARLRRYRQLVKRSLAPKQHLTDDPIPTTLEPVPEIEMKIAAAIPKDEESRQFLYRQLASYFNMLLSEWDAALSRRDLSVKQSLQGRQAYTAMIQSRDNIKPLIRKFEKSDLTDGVLQPIIEIVTKAQQRRYVDANDAYLRLSIGKAYVSPGDLFYSYS